MVSASAAETATVHSMSDDTTSTAPRAQINVDGLTSRRGESVTMRAPGPAKARTMATRADDLKTSGLKATLPRLKVLEVFQRSTQRHLSAEDIYKVLLAEGSEIGLATVYRVLMQFTQAGLLSRQHFEEGRAVFELNEGRHHDHMVCMRCGKVQEFFDPAIEQRQRELAAEHGFELHEHSLSMYGLCSDPACRDAKRGA
jgi:Fur family ferric uptake transcriptional regulator